MRTEGLVACQPSPFRVTTTADTEATTTPDLVERDFTATRPGVKFVGDITYIHTWAGFVYLATVIDCYSKKVVGWSIKDHMRTELVTDALKNAATTTLIEADAVFHSDPVFEVQRLDFGVAELDALALQSVEGPRELAQTALTHHLPEQRRLVHVLRGAVDEDNTVAGGETAAELARGHQPTCTTTQDDGAASRPDRPTGGRLRQGGALVHLLDGVGKARLVELVLREDDFAVRPDQDAPGNPAVGQGTEQRAITIRDHGELERELLRPSTTDFLGFQRTDVDDLKPVPSEALIEFSDGRRLLPTTVSGRFPEDQQHSIRANYW